MRAIAIEDFGGPERLQLMSLPRPKPGKKEVLIRAVAVGVNPVDWAIREGRLREILPHAFPLVPGWDVAGVIEEMEKTPPGSARETASGPTPGNRACSGAATPSMSPSKSPRSR